MPRRKIDDQFPRLSGKHFGNRLRQIRVRKNMSISTLAERIGVLETYIPQLERGEKLPSFDTLVYIANALEVTTDDLLCDYIDADKTTIPTRMSQKLEGLNKTQQRHVEDMIDKIIAYMKDN